MDVLSDILEMVMLKSAVYFQKRFAAPWGMEVAKSNFSQFHIVVNGSCQLGSPEISETLDLNPGDIVLFPFGGEHWIADSGRSQKTPGQEVMQSIISGEEIFQGSGSGVKIICGHFEFDRRFDHPFIKALPAFIHIKEKLNAELSWLELASRVIMQEAGTDKPGSAAISIRLAEVLFIQMLRSFIYQSDNSHGFLAALRNEQINHALGLIHLKPNENWTLAALARSCGISRTLLANKFRDLVGVTPMQYLSDLRLLKAREFLNLSSDVPVYLIAEKVGYTSEASFSRAFKRKFQVTPASYRRMA